MKTLFDFKRATAEEFFDLATMSKLIYNFSSENITDESGDQKWANITENIGLPNNFLGGNNSQYVPINFPATLGSSGKAVVYRSRDNSNTIAVAFEGTGDAGDVIAGWLQTITIPVLNDALIDFYFGVLVNSLNRYATENETCCEIKQ